MSCVNCDCEKCLDVKFKDINRKKIEKYLKSKYWTEDLIGYEWTKGDGTLSGYTLDKTNESEIRLPVDLSYNSSKIEANEFLKVMAKRYLKVDFEVMLEHVKKANSLKFKNLFLE